MVLEQGTMENCSKEVLYIGSAVPLETSEGLEAIQQPLRSRYPQDDDTVHGILSQVTILPSGIELRYKHEPGHVVLFPFSSLSMCAAVRCVHTTRDITHPWSVRFVSLSSPEAGGVNSRRPAIFTAITRRTKGVQVLECHGFITMSPQDALDLVQWTSDLDRRSKYGGLDQLDTGLTSWAHEASRADTSFYTDSASLPELASQLPSGDWAHSSSPPLVKEPLPPNGYFYSTKDAQIKKFSLHKFSGRSDDSVTRSSVDHFSHRPESAAAHYSAQSAVYPTRRRQKVLVPVSQYPSMPVSQRGLVHPIMMAPPPVTRAPAFVAYPRPRFFSPPPVRVQPVPMLVPPTVYSQDSLARTGGRRPVSRASSRSSSPSSVPSFSHSSSRLPKKTPDDSSEYSFRPHTPPTDYEGPRRSRFSRKDEFQNQPHAMPDARWVEPALPGRYAPTPVYGYYTLPPPTVVVNRPRSVPPYVETRQKKSKTKKGKKGKKSKKGPLADEETRQDKVPSEANMQPRDMRRFDHQFQHERAFSKSLTEQARHPLRESQALDAYSLNDTR